MDNVAKSGMAKSGITKKANIGTLENLGYCVPLFVASCQSHFVHF